MIPFGKFFPSTSRHGAEIKRAISSDMWLKSAYRTADTVLRNLATDERERAFIPVFLSTITKTNFKRGFGFKLSLRSPGDLVEMRVCVEIVQGWDRSRNNKVRTDFLLMDAGLTSARKVDEPERTCAFLDSLTVNRWLLTVMQLWIEMVSLELPKQIAINK